MAIPIPSSTRRPAVALVLALQFGPRPAVAAGPPCATDATVSVSVASELGDEYDDAAMRDYLASRLPERLEQVGLCASDDADRRVAVTIAWSSASRGDYAISLHATAPGAEAFELQAAECEGCSSPELLTRVALDLPAALDGLKARAAHEDADTPPPAVPTASPPPRPPVHSERLVPHDRGRMRLGHLGRAGIGVATVGVAAIITGAVLWAEARASHPSDSRYRLSLRAPGIATVAGGLGAAAVGGTMVGIGTHRARRITLSPVVGPAHAGTAISGSF